MRQVVGAFLLTALASCTAAPKPPPVEPEPVKQQAAPKPAEAPRRKAPVVTVTPKPPPQAALATPAPRKPVTNDDPNQLFGLNGHHVADLLGPANFVRRDGTAEVWQYRAEACVLDIYLYRESGTLTVAHVDLRKREKAAQPPRQCFREILTRSG